MVNTSFPVSWGQTFLTLIPRVSNPKFVTDFCPISLCNVCYKIISKLLANRLLKVIPSLIGKDQASFVKGRTSTDRILVIWEVVHSLSNNFRDPPRMIVKVGIEEAYDTVSWEVILAILAKMGFPTVWIAWVKACLSSASFALLINGMPTRFIKSSRGIRQEDPISSYLFILVAQNLTSILNTAL